jgi:uncharacterized alkaline shock family protein YloU
VHVREQRSVEVTETTYTTGSTDNPAGSSSAGSALATTAAPGGSGLVTEQGTTRIANTVVAKIAGMAAKEIPGVQAMGTGAGRAFGALRSRVPGAGGGQPALSQGVAVEVGERQAAVDLDIVTYYGESIVEVTDAVRRNVVDRLEAMTGLEVTEVNINVDDIYVEGQDDQQSAAPEPRVQ